MRLKVARLTFLMGMVAGWLPTASGFTNMPVGSFVENIQLRTVDGQTESLVGNAQANVVIFFRPDQPHSQVIARRFSETIEQEFRDKSVHLVSLVSGRYSSDAIRTFKSESGLTMPVLVDEGDEQVGRFGVILHPSVGIINSKNILVSYIHFSEINFVDVVRGYIRYVLGEINDDQLRDILAPTLEQVNENKRKAQSRLSLARVLFKQNKLDRAMQEIQLSLSFDDTLAGAHSLYGLILAAQGDCSHALEEFEVALKLDPKDPDAQSGMKSCGSHR